MKKIKVQFSLLILLTISSYLIAQNTVGHIISSDVYYHQYGKLIFEPFVNNFPDYNTFNSNFYLKDDEGLKKLKVDSIIGETLSNKLVYYSAKYDINDRPKLQFTRDSTKKIIDCVMLPSARVTIGVKLVDIETSRIEAIENVIFPNSSYVTYTNQRNKPAIEFVIKVDWKRFYGNKDPDAKGWNQKDLEKRTNNLYSFYWKKIKAVIDARIKSIAADFPKMAQPFLLSNMQEELFELNNFDASKLEKRVAGISLNAGNLKDLKARGQVNMYKEENVHGQKFYKNIGPLFIVEADAETATLKTHRLFFNNSKVKEALLSGSEIRFAYGENSPIIKRGRIIDEQRVVSVISKSVMNNFEEELMLLEIDAFLIERAEDFDLDYFLDLSKSEKFLDAENNIESKQVGVGFLFERKENIFALSNIKTSELLISAKSKSEFFNKWMKVFNLNIEILEVTKQNKKKIKELLVRTDLNMIGYTKLYISVKNVENVGGKNMIRYKRIAEARVARAISSRNIFLKIKDGGKELKEAYEANIELTIELEIKGPTLLDKLENLNKMGKSISPNRGK